MRVIASSLASLLMIATLSAAEAPLTDVVRSGDVRAIRAALQTSDVNRPDADGSTALHWAVHRDAVEVVKLLVDAGANVKAVNRYGVAPLTLACTNGNAAIVEQLLRAGADPHTTAADGETALMTAARTGKVDVVRALLAHGADVSARETWR
jgi:ankyrin repeat protein